jgi:hypothetical protein
MTQLYQPTLIDDLSRATRAIADGRAPVESPEYMREVAQLQELCKELRSNSKPDHRLPAQIEGSENCATSSPVGLNIPGNEFSDELAETAETTLK